MATELQDYCLYAWGTGLVNLIHAYDPEIVVIVGGIANSQEILIPYFKTFIAGKAWTPWGQPEIKVAAFPDTAALLGVPSLFNC